MGIATKETQIVDAEATCPVCGTDRRQLGEWLNEPLVWELWPNHQAGGTWLRSENCQRACETIWNCTKCRDYFNRQQSALRFNQKNKGR